MLVLTWHNLLIWSVVLAVALLILGGIWKIFKRFLKFWFAIVVVLVLVKLAMDAGFI